MEILKDIETLSNFAEKLKGISKVIIWAGKTNEKRLENMAFNFLISQSEENFNSIVSELNLVKKKRPLNQIFVVYGQDLLLRGEVIEILEEEGFESFFLSSESVLGSATLLDKILEEMKKSILVLVIAGADDIGGKDEGDETKFFLRPRLNVVMELGLSIGLLGVRKTLVLWDQRIERKDLSNYQGHLTINLDTKKEGKRDLKFNLGILRKLVQNILER